MMKEDERQFMRPECIRFSRASEWVLARKDSSSDAPSERRFVMLFRQGGMRREEFGDYLGEIGHSLKGRLKRVRWCSIDVVETAKISGFPFDAILWISADVNLENLCIKSGDLPGLLSLAEIESYQSDPEVLRYWFEGDVSRTAS
tara:strand:- start:579 stop:1013 length:435 start_codon:yes stop_codon:yes gene_type:complete